MGVFSENAIIGASNASGYNIDNSCRFDDGDSPYLTRTWPSDGNTLTWTWSCWIKRSNFTFQKLFDSATASQNSHFTTLSFNSDQLEFYNKTSSGVTVLSAAKYRDPGAWYHIMLVYDSPQATAANRTKMYVNGSLITLTGTYVNQNQASYMCDDSKRIDLFRRVSDGGSSYFDGYAAELHFIEGQALTPASFGETDEDTNEWKAIKYDGTYGTNGFYLDFSNSAALGTDSSGNGNNFTSSGLTANDQMIDTPQNSTGGNFATLNPLYYSSTAYDIREGNLKFLNSTANWWKVLSSFGMTSGKWYCEVRYEDNGSGPLATFGAVSNFTPATIPNLNGQYVGQKTYEQGYHKNGYTETGASNPGTGTYASYAAGDKMGCAIDVDNLKIYWAKNGTWQNSGDPTSGSTGTGARDLSNSTSGTDGLWYFGFTAHTMNATVNFGQDSSFAGTETAQGNSDGNGCGDFYYTPPAGYLALCSDNLSDPSIALSEEHFNTVLWSGNSTAGRAVTGVGFAPDFCWLKARTGGNENHTWCDITRGTGNHIRSDSNAAQINSLGLTSFDSDGFTLPNHNQVNGSGYTYVGWNWKGGGTGVSNTDGNITSTVSANVAAGFSIVKYTGSGNTGATVGHGLSKAPEYIIIKNTDETQDWKVGNDHIGTSYTSDAWAQYKFLEINNNDAVTHDNGIWRTAPDASVFYLWDGISVNQSTKVSIAYCFHSVEGYSDMGVYTGSGTSADGAFVYTGFRPAFVMAKNYAAAAKSWVVYDNKRDTYNEIYKQLVPNTNSTANTSEGRLDFVSNGFKWRIGDSWHNDGSFVYLAFAESPFKYSRAR